MSLTNEQITALYDKHAKCQEESMYVSGWVEFAHAIAAIEREECAKVCENERSEPLPYTGEFEYRISEKAFEVAQECAAAIRARGNP